MRVSATIVCGLKLLALEEELTFQELLDLTFQELLDLTGHPTRFPHVAFKRRLSTALHPTYSTSANIQHFTQHASRML